MIKATRALHVTMEIHDIVALLMTKNELPSSRETCL